jgi:hypothetical protein
MQPKNPLQVPRFAEIQNGGKFWGYLDSVALQSRYVLAAHFLRRARHIVEVGGYRNNLITNFLTGHHESVTVYSLDAEFEPQTRDTLNGAACRVRHIGDYFQNGEHPTEGLGVLALGLEIQGDLSPFVGLVRASQVAVLEVPIGHEPTAGCLRQVLTAVPHQVVCQIDLDLSSNESRLQEELQSTNMNKPFWRRRLYVLEGRDPVSQTTVDAAPEYRCSA